MSEWNEWFKICMPFTVVIILMIVYCAVACMVQGFCIALVTYQVIKWILALIIVYLFICGLIGFWQSYRDP